MEDNGVFKDFPKIPRLSREIIITEKVDGTNAQINITKLENGVSYSPEIIAGTIVLTEHGKFALQAGSRNRWLQPGKQDNFGFAQWVEDNSSELWKLGPGRHFGEWFGQGIQRGYGLEKKRFALFSVNRWTKVASARFPKAVLPPLCCDVVPVLAIHSTFNSKTIDATLELLRSSGSVMVPGFMKPEGIVVFHTASGQLFKKTIEGDEKPKGKTNE